MKRLSSCHALCGIVLLLVAVVALSARVQDQPRTLYERARLLDEGNQNLAEAIRLYGQVADSAKDQPALAARALVQMGRCQERLGQAEARKAYQRVLDEYPQQLESVKLARERLAALTQQAGNAGKPRFRKIQIPTKLPILASGMLSPDGQKLAVISDGSVWLVPVYGKTDPNIAGAPVRLTEPMSAWDVSNVSLSWSGDGKWISFRTGQYGKPVEGHYIVLADGGEPQRLPISWRDWPPYGDVLNCRCALSADAKTIYLAAGNTTEELRVYSMPARGGARLPLTDPVARQPALSPDGSRIAYVKMHQNSNGYLSDDQVWIQAIDGGDPVHVCDAAAAWSPVFSPDGGKIAFIARETGNRQVWIVPLGTDSRPSAPPSKFNLPGETNNLLAGWTKDNKIGILIASPEVVPLYTVPAEGGKAVQLTTEYTAMPRWTPDGKRIYFDGAHRGDRANIEYVPSDGGSVARLSITPGNIQPVFPSQLTISPDGRTLSYYGFFRSGNPDRGLYMVPVEGGTATRVAMIGPDGNAPEWSPDGSQIAFIRGRETDSPSANNIFVVRRGGDEPRQVSTDADRVERSNLAWSPDGELIAFFGQDNTLRAIPASGGSSRILTSTQSASWSGIAWSPDGKKIAYTGETGKVSGLFVISRDGGESKEIVTGLDADHWLKVDWSPDGKRIAFTAQKGGEPELWLMEDFLPLVNGRK
jgi:Tol biopolymer transport system component